MKVLQDLNKSELEEYIVSLGEPKYRAGQIYLALTSGKSVDEISNISKELKEKINNDYCSKPIEIVKTLTGKDGTVKYAYKLNDGKIIEGVLMSYKYGNTLCVSTQVGCRMGCKFCASTLNGLERNLSSGEILGQILVVNRLLGGGEKDKRKITNVVLMGSGEPLDNYENVTKFLNNVSDSDGINISQRNISLSTCGIVPNIYKLADDGYSITLTISLHSPFDEKRREIMPIANVYSVKEIIDAVKYYFQKTKRRIVFEYALIKDVNDSPACVNEISKLFKNFSFHFNIIPLNDVKERELVSAGRKASYRFVEMLEEKKIGATVRRTMGEDIEGACGQLRNKLTSNN